MKAQLKRLVILGLAGLALILSASTHADGSRRGHWKSGGYYDAAPPAYSGDQRGRFSSPEPLVRPLPGPIVGPSLLDRGGGTISHGRRFSDDRPIIHERRFGYDQSLGHNPRSGHSRSFGYGRSYGYDRGQGVPTAPIVNQYPHSWMSDGTQPVYGY